MPLTIRGQTYLPNDELLQPTSASAFSRTFSQIAADITRPADLGPTRNDALCINDNKSISTIARAKELLHQALPAFPSPPIRSPRAHPAAHASPRLSPRRNFSHGPEGT